MPYQLLMKEMQIALVVDEKNKLVGTIDGDIEGLLRGLALDSSVEKVTNKDFHSINYFDDKIRQI